MKVTFLGTGTSQGIPIIACDCEVCKSNDPKDNRLRSSVLIEIDDTVVVIDTGPDFRYQMLREKVKDVDAILYTHRHRDHIAGLDDVRAFNFINKKKVDIYAEESVLDAIKEAFSYAFKKENKYPGAPEINTNIIENKAFTVNGLKIIPIRLMHCKMPVFGFRIGDFTYITDANYISEEEKEKIKGSKYVVINALRKEKHISHFTLDEAVALLEEIAPEKGYLTHISHQLGLQKKVQKELPENIFLAYDGLTLEL